MLKIKLVPTGKKHTIQYRICVKEEHSKLTGHQTDILGFYRPQTKQLVIDEKRLQDWQKRGAQMTVSLSKLLKTWKNS